VRGRKEREKKLGEVKRMERRRNVMVALVIAK
jgi:hypothetical protein